MTCPFCQKTIELEDRHTYHEVLGWEADRKAGGTNALRLRQRTGKQAHWFCVDKAVHGLQGQIPFDL